jgi:hypothetical protein
MSYGRMGGHLGLIIRRPTSAYGFRGLRYIYQPPPSRMPRFNRLGRLGSLGDSGYSDPTTGEWIDTTGQAAAGAIGPGIQPQPYVAPSILTPADTVPVGKNYNPAIDAYFAPSLAQNAAMAINSALVPAGATAPQIAAAPAFSSSTVMWLGGGLLALLAISSTGKKGRR